MRSSQAQNTIELISGQVLTLLYHTIFQPGAHRQEGGSWSRQKDRSESGLAHANDGDELRQMT